MRISINGVTISDEAVRAEAVHHAHAGDPIRAAGCALAIRELLWQRACEAGVAADVDVCEDDAWDAACETLFEREVRVPERTEEECLKFYESHKERYVAGELVEASHILFGLTPNASTEAIRRQAEVTLKQVLADPSRFAELAKSMSNCPSGAQGGNLGQIGRGDAVPEFERALFSGDTGILPRLVNTVYGFHILFVARRVAGRPIPFESVRASIADTLSARARATAAEQYVRVLASRARVEGIDLGAAPSPLVQ